MSIKDKKQIIIVALKALGVRFIKLEITSDNDTVGGVYVDGAYFGTFDYIRMTFVDWSERSREWAASSLPAAKLKGSTKRRPLWSYEPNFRGSRVSRPPRILRDDMIIACICVCAVQKEWANCSPQGPKKRGRCFAAPFWKYEVVTSRYYLTYY